MFIRWSDPDQAAVTPNRNNSQVVAESDFTSVASKGVFNFEVVCNKTQDIRTEADVAGATHEGTILYIIEENAP